MNKTTKIGFGGGCHWCTEGVFQSLKGVLKVEQGWISAANEPQRFSEAVIVHFDEAIIDLKTLIDIHLSTHASTSDHSFRDKYRSAIYAFDKEQAYISNELLRHAQHNFNKPIITKVLPFESFRLNTPDQLNYFYNKPKAPFCKSYIYPKLDTLKQDFPEYFNAKKVLPLIEKQTRS